MRLSTAAVKCRAAPRLRQNEGRDRLRHHAHRCGSRRQRQLPVVSFDGVETWPSLVAANAAGELRFGLDADAVRHEPGWAVLRSFKHLLKNAGPQAEVSLG